MSRTKSRQIQLCVDTVPPWPLQSQTNDQALLSLPLLVWPSMQHHAALSVQRVLHSLLHCWLLCRWKRRVLTQVRRFCILCCSLECLGLLSGSEFNVSTGDNASQHQKLNSFGALSLFWRWNKCKWVRPSLRAAAFLLWLTFGQHWTLSWHQVVDRRIIAVSLVASAVSSTCFGCHRT